MLGVDEKATNEEIERALKRARAKCHPDRFKSSAKKLQAEARFKELGAAYEVILAARKRDRAAA
jgi:DnaJ-class molecular chaperone